MVEHELEVLGRNKKGMRPACSYKAYVKVTHRESGITVTRSGKTTLEAKGLALIELEEMVRDWLIFS